MKTKILICLSLFLVNCSFGVRGQDDYWFRKGLKVKKPKKKIECFTKSIETEGAKVETYLQRGDAYWSLAIDAAYNSKKIIIVFNKDKADFHNVKLMYDKASEDYTNAMKIDSSCAKAYIGRSNVYWQLGQKDNALADLSHIIGIDSNNAELYYKRGFLYRNNFRDNEKALLDLSRSIEIDKNYKYAYGARGFIYYHLKQYENAMADYNKVIEIDPNDAYAYCSRGDIYKRTGQYDKAISEYNRTIEIDHKNFAAYNKRGFIYLIQSQYEKALGDFNKTISLQHDKFPYAYNNKGYTYLQQDKIDPAIENFKKCLSVEDKFSAANLNLALVYYMSGDKEKAEFYLEQARAKAPHLQEGIEGIINGDNDWFYWTDRDKETLEKMFVELK